MTTTARQSAVLAAVAARAQPQKEIMDDAEGGGAPKTLPPKMSAVAEPSMSTFAINDVALLLSECILSHRRHR